MEFEKDLGTEFNNNFKLTEYCTSAGSAVKKADQYLGTFKHKINIYKKMFYLNIIKR